MNTYRSSKAKEIEERIKALQEEQAAEAERVRKAYEKTGYARVALVEELLDVFGIEPTEKKVRLNKKTKAVIRDKDGNPRMEDIDRDETMRMERLRDAIFAAVGAHEKTVENQQEAHQ